MNKGDKFVVELEYINDIGYNDIGLFRVLGSLEQTRLYKDSVEKAVAAYAAKQAQPAPVASDWQPKVGERVLLLGEVKADYGDGTYLIFDPADNDKYTALRSAIVGPAPVRARFAVGGEVFLIETLETVKIVEQTGLGEWKVWDGYSGVNVFVKEADLLTLAEARERLGK